MGVTELFSTRPRVLLMLSGLLSMVVMGASQALYGPFFPFFAETFGVGASRLGLLPTAHFAGATTGVLLGGPAIKRFSYATILVTGALVLSTGYLTIAFAPAWWSVLGGAALIGVGFGLLIHFNMLVDYAFSRLGPSALQLINAGFSIGAISAPLLAAGSLRISSTAPAFGTGAAVAFMVLVVLIRNRGTIREAESGKQTAEQHRPSLRMFLAPLIVFLPLNIIYVGAEASFSSWIPTHLSALFTVTVASAVTSGFWIAFTAGRLVAVPVGLRLSPGILVSGALTLATAGAVLSAAPIALMAPVGYVVAGFALGPIFPGAVSWVRRSFPLEADRVIGVIIASGGVGGMTIPPLVGLGVEHLGTQAIPLSLAVVLIPGVVVALTLGRSRSPQIERSAHAG